MSKKNNKKTPKKSRRQRMSRGERLKDAVSWINEFEGRVLVQKYKKRYGLSTILTAIDELQKLEVELDQEYVNRIKKSVENNVKHAVSQEKTEKPAEEVEESIFPLKPFVDPTKEAKAEEKVEEKTKEDKPFRNTLY